MPSDCVLIPMSSHSTTTCKQLLTTGTHSKGRFPLGESSLALYTPYGHTS